MGSRRRSIQAGTVLGCGRPMRFPCITSNYISQSLIDNCTRLHLKTAAVTIQITMKLALGLILPFLAVTQGVEQQDTKGSKLKTPRVASENEFFWWCSDVGVVPFCSWCCSGSQCTHSGSWYWVCSVPPAPASTSTSTGQSCLTDGEVTDCGLCCEGMECNTYSFGTFCMDPNQTVNDAGARPKPSSMVVAAPVFTAEE